METGSSRHFVIQPPHSLKTGHHQPILVLDMIMTPGIDGLETYQRVLEINPKQKAVLVSGFTETDRARETQKLGAGAYVKKPYALVKIGVAILDELQKIDDGVFTSTIGNRQC
jgi:DNA-binding NtrC family response regulator